MAELLKSHRNATGQFGKKQLDNKDEFLPTVNGFDEFFDNVYHVNAEESPKTRTIRRILSSGGGSGRLAYSTAE